MLFYVFKYVSIYQTHFILDYLFGSTLSIKLMYSYCNIIREQEKLLNQIVMMWKNKWLCTVSVDSVFIKSQVLKSVLNQQSLLMATMFFMLYVKLL